MRLRSVTSLRVNGLNKWGMENSGKGRGRCSRPKRQTQGVGYSRRVARPFAIAPTCAAPLPKREHAQPRRAEPAWPFAGWRPAACKDTAAGSKSHVVAVGRCLTSTRHRPGRCCHRTWQGPRRASGSEAQEAIRSGMPGRCLSCGRVSCRRRGRWASAARAQLPFVSGFRSAEQASAVRFRAGRRLSTCTDRPETRMNPRGDLLIVNRSAENGERKWAASRPSAASSGRPWSTGKPLFPSGTGKKNPNRMRVGISHYGGAGGNRTLITGLWCHQARCE